VELAIVIGERASYVHANEAMNYVAGFCVCHDVSEREFQLERGGTWSKGKGCPTFGPLGPWLVTADEIADVQKLGMWLTVNGETMQKGSTQTMIFNCAQLVSYISHFMILEPGDVITTGTPPGVGMALKPPRFLQPGDVVALGIEGLGEQRQTIMAFDEWTATVSRGQPTNP
jgi:2-keto-4-pentenoate hydratase/2-oxohepta-3-ene-1,7-dioic acid hydratase in catechol pathway